MSKKQVAYPIFILIILLIAIFPLQALTSICQKFPGNLVDGHGPLPYNYRIIDGHIHAGGHPLNPANGFKNSDQATITIFNSLKSKGINTVIDLEDTKRIYARYQALLKQCNLKLLHVPMNEFKTPSKKEWEEIKTAMREPAYIHCKWGADRTGIIIAKYLIEDKGYSKSEAIKAVATGGSHAGSLGGLKTIPYAFVIAKFL